ncbi:phospholipase A-2-activating protein [Cryptosporidium andersoni]|uniref:Phospholipase A-2-activating protein n=1 Tax=Cryptosporidium andersoni TaxID=117008 RepID=A0A1J4MUE0_9CRYT|nr:phospholipase A-2-activating protein [Cryptosporidium andersoni]
MFENNLVNEIYYLSSELHGHTKSIRCICILKDDRIVTGGQDNKIIIWRKRTITGDDHLSTEWVMDMLLMYHKRYILTLEASSIGVGNSEEAVSFYSSGLDQIIHRVSADDGSIILTFEGHTSAVCSLSEIPSTQLLVSGSWDGTARVWNILTGICILVLNGHSHAVTTAVTPILFDKVVYIITGSQDKKLRVWNSSSGQCIYNYDDAHDDIIRSIELLVNCESYEKSCFRVLSASNDTKIKIWDINFFSSLSVELKHLATLSAHTSFVFSVCASKKHPNRFFTASDDCTIVIWDYNSLNKILPVQSIPMSATVWQVVEMHMEDTILSVSEDSVCRMWTTDINKALPLEIREKQRKEANNLKIGTTSQQLGLNDIDSLGDLPHVNMLQAYKGKRLGETKLFRDGDLIVSYMWQGENWEKIGEVIGIDKQNYYDGDFYFPKGNYDYLFDVELHGSGIFKKLPYNNGDNILEIAQKFCAREKISITHCEAICKFIKQNTKQMEIIQIRDNEQIRGNLDSNLQKYTPMLNYVVFKSANIDGLIEKLLREAPRAAIRNSTPMDSSTEIGLYDVEEKYLEEALRKIREDLKNNNFSFKNSFRAVEIDIIYRKMSCWTTNPEICVPILDLWRILALHPQSSDIHKKSDKGWWLIACALKLISSVAQNVNAKEISTYPSYYGPLIQVCLKYLCNTFFNNTNRQVLLQHCEDILSSISYSVDLIIKKSFHISRNQSINFNVIISLLSLLLNYSIGFFEYNNSKGKEFCIKIILKLIPLYLEETSEYTRVPNELLSTTLITIGNICSVSSPNAICKKMLAENEFLVKLLAQSDIKGQPLALVKMISSLLEL